MGDSETKKFEDLYISACSLHFHLVYHGYHSRSVNLYLTFFFNNMVLYPAMTHIYLVTHLLMAIQVAFSFLLI